MRKTKVICTMGPATDQGNVLEELIEEGMNVARMNFSHSSHEEHKERIDRVRKLSKKHHKSVAILLDTKGPEIRVCSFEDGFAMLHAGQQFTLTCEKREGNEETVSVTYPELYHEVKQGTTILLDDGLIEMTVESIEGLDIHCIVKNDGMLSNNKGVNIPAIHVNMPFMSNRDQSDVRFGIEQDVDFIAASFVRSAEDVHIMRRFLKENGGSKINIIAKIENSEGIDNIDEIIEAADAIMIARGDMGVELPEEEVPVIQKMIIKKVYEAGKQVITATQMLDSMVKNPRPTRAETADVANAIYDGTSAVMLSGETAAGRFPVDSLRTMIRIAERTERDIDYKKRFFHHERAVNPDVTDAISHATCTTAYDLNASAVVTVTKSGRSARMISRYRPSCMIIGGSTDEKVCRQINMSWGVTPILLEEKSDAFELFAHAIEVAKERKLLEKGDVAVITSGVPVGVSGTTNMIKVQVVE